MNPVNPFNVAESFKAFDAGVSMKDAVASAIAEDPTLSKKRARATVIKARRSQRRQLAAEIANVIENVDTTVKAFSKSVCIRLYNQTDMDAAIIPPVRKESKAAKAVAAKLAEHVEKIAEEKTKKELQSILTDAIVDFPRKANKLELATIAVQSVLKAA